MKRNIDLIVIHCSGTREGESLSLSALNEAWLAAGFKEIGYHYYITRNGKILSTCPLQVAGNHTGSYDAHSIGICYEGGRDAAGCPADTRTEWQKHAMQVLVFVLLKDFPQAQVLGHCDLKPDGAGLVKAWEQLGECPCFEVKKELPDAPGPWMKIRPKRRGQ